MGLLVWWHLTYYWRRAEDLSDSNGTYDVVRLKPSGCLVADTAIQKKKIWSYTNYSGNMECKKHEMEKFKTIKDKMKWLCTDILGIEELRWTGVGSDHPVIT